ncbi:hypothetical protein GCM10022235_21890 [Kribbella ginsengisoli]|uniref:Uncharacterized protein n=1 Tax=Kribbella ginsengisoli TaxID=363865 RepID=A0ABP6WP84_9ACTN
METSPPTWLQPVSACTFPSANRSPIRVFGASSFGFPSSVTDTDRKDRPSSDPPPPGALLVGPLLVDPPPPGPPVDGSLPQAVNIITPATAATTIRILTI